MKKLISMTVLAAVFCCLQAKTASAEIKPCSSYSEISCAGQQTYGWGCKPGSTACSPSSSGGCTCGAMTTNPGTGGAGVKAKPPAASGAVAANAAGSGKAAAKAGAKGGKAVKDTGFLPGSPQAHQTCNPASIDSSHFPSGNIVPCRACLSHEVKNHNAVTKSN